jgi:crotonobetainyl-CoA:carnitine CoA-transferase CaiB-like acyl-CoA transferase
LAGIDACVGPVNTIDEALNDPQALARGTSVTSSPFDESGTAFHTLPSFPRISGIEDEQRYPPPQLGQHTTELLRGLGYELTEIEKFKEEGVI